MRTAKPRETATAPCQQYTDKREHTYLLETTSIHTSTYPVINNFVCIYKKAGLLDEAELPRFKDAQLRLRKGEVGTWKIDSPVEGLGCFGGVLILPMSSV